MGIVSKYELPEDFEEYRGDNIEDQLPGYKFALANRDPQLFYAFKVEKEEETVDDYKQAIAKTLSIPLDNTLLKSTTYFIVQTTNKQLIGYNNNK
ncbi:hypothetical protein PPL_04352 [Heterostelium album PN500]|uniref:Uncharacterized protein n=1 Tax=Heterostelium pallidum (strain ATCC 26659 / Pp 5 / PN500) TaxID=670386 RepID=D3B7B5_HETP5|nr:hypothetical protein PPL_04352 [Heterostelium album PN500]EFA82658.1 hypothetical protein PPL_04352 [Heterostelium album PN500]|eukprot:XP_020434775.1 hypothetical protein PPL_04352 [Heterostelium album PN500]